MANAYRSKKYRESARGQQCTVQLFGVCNHNPETTVLHHLTNEGMGLKGPDYCGIYVCSDCHAFLHSSESVGLHPGELSGYLLFALTRTLTVAFEEGKIKWG